jgi:hypothetical protein
VSAGPSRWQWWPAGLTGVGLLVICLLSDRHDRQQALLSYLAAFLFFTGLSLGSMALLLVHALTGGAWGKRLRSPLWAAARGLPVQALLVVPILIGLHSLYPWMQDGAGKQQGMLPAQGWYLNSGFFVARSIGYFVLWCGLLAVLARSMRSPGRALSAGIAAVGLIVYALSTLLAATDWAMSLVPQWHSSTFGLLVATGWMLAAAALAVLNAVSVNDVAAPLSPAILRDFGNLLLALVLALSYLAFMQYLTIWVADQPSETAWYIPRTLTSWRWLAWFLIVFLFAVPFAVLLSREAKTRRSWLQAVAVMVLIGSLAHALWLVLPDLRVQGVSIHWTDLYAVVGAGALWSWIYFSNWQRASRAQVVSIQTAGTAHG